MPDNQDNIKQKPPDAMEVFVKDAPKIAELQTVIEEQRLTIEGQQQTIEGQQSAIKRQQLFFALLLVVSLLCSFVVMKKMQPKEQDVVYSQPSLVDFDNAIYGGSLPVIDMEQANVAMSDLVDNTEAIFYTIAPVVGDDLDRVFAQANTYRQLYKDQLSLNYKLQSRFLYVVALQDMVTRNHDRLSKIFEYSRSNSELSTQDHSVAVRLYVAYLNGDTGLLDNIDPKVYFGQRFISPLTYDRATVADIKKDILDYHTKVAAVNGKMKNGNGQKKINLSKVALVNFHSSKRDNSFWEYLRPKGAQVIPIGRFNATETKRIPTLYYMGDEPDNFSFAFAHVYTRHFNDVLLLNKADSLNSHYSQKDAKAITDLVNQNDGKYLLIY